MVYNTTRTVKLPHHCSIILKAISANKKQGMDVHGKGMGSVLLQTGGPGAGSSYMDMDDYIATTGINPYTRAQGTGVTKKISSKLSKLNISPPTVTRRKNIVMTM